LEVLGITTKSPTRSATQLHENSGNEHTREQNRESAQKIMQTDTGTTSSERGATTVRTLAGSTWPRAQVLPPTLRVTKEKNIPSNWGFRTAKYIRPYLFLHHGCGMPLRPPTAHSAVHCRLPFRVRFLSFRINDGRGVREGRPPAAQGGAYCGTTDHPPPRVDFRFLIINAL
jgi:hypothetical protein